MPLFLVQYSYSPDIERRLAERPAHREWLGGLFDEGRLVAAGPYADDGAPGGQLIIRAETAGAVEELLPDDPYAQIGVIADATIRQWTVVFGPWQD
ncbi:YciI family protein [Saxibacter everestensis]|uniref:YciI family protein n=1 Tax=Saxibacter everestensis TaxID=2909229 RepID=A0ABY8QXR9_9MICO|nr:YciI family protein [Brevibacteriaceae bacterium ZFBP1038]